MSGQESAKILSADDKPDPAAGPAGLSAAEAVARLQKAAETLSADAEKLRETPADAPEVELRLPAPAAPKPGFRLAGYLSRGQEKAAAASVLVVAAAFSGWLGLQNRPDTGGSASVAASRAQPAPTGEAAQASEAELRRKIEALTQDVQSLRAQVQKQAEDARAVQAKATAASAAHTASVARVDRFERDAETKFTQHNERIERIERLAADPVVTSSIDKKAPPAPAQSGASEPRREGLRTIDPKIAPDSYVLRSVRNGVAVVQTRGGLVEVGPGDTIPGVGRVRSIEKVDGRWVVVTRNGVIDGD